MNYAKHLDRNELVLAVWAAEFARCMNGAASVRLGAPAMREMADRAAESANRLVEAIHLLTEVEFRVASADEVNDLMTWEKFVAACQQGGVNKGGYGELTTDDHHVSNVRVHPSSALSESYVRPDWATHVRWYDR